MRNRKLTPKNFHRVLLVILVIISSALAAANLPNAQEFTNVRLKYYTSTKQRDYPLPNEPITLRVDNKDIDGTTDKKGLVSYRQIPCDKEVTVYFRGKPQATFSRYIRCGTKPSWIYFFDSFAGGEGKIEQQK